MSEIPISKETQKEIEKLGEYNKKICATKETARAFLVRAGINNPDGSLNDNYK
jgi:hypothetical protein